uniref:Uncharacterized protein n=1 Tax=Timema poppense TaxID=170557 RepID=A0A7R9H0P9_TIMPO|nr:unnamed protein product [Timema poppensis]
MHSLHQQYPILATSSGQRHFEEPRHDSDGNETVPEIELETLSSVDRHTTDRAKVLDDSRRDTPPCPLTLKSDTIISAKINLVAMPGIKPDTLSSKQQEQRMVINENHECWVARGCNLNTAHHSQKDLETHCISSKGTCHQTMVSIIFNKVVKSGNLCKTVLDVL